MADDNHFSIETELFEDDERSKASADMFTPDSETSSARRGKKHFDDCASETTDDDASVLYSMHKRPSPGLRQLCEIQLKGDEHEHLDGGRDKKTTPWSTRTKVLIVSLALMISLVAALAVVLSRQVAVGASTEPAIAKVTDSQAIPDAPTIDVMKPAVPDSFPTAIFIAPTSGPWKTTTSNPTFSTDPTEMPPPTASVYPSTQVNLAFTYLESILSVYAKREYLLDASQPQGRAFLQIMMDHLDAIQTLSSTKVLQSFGVLTLYYSTSPKVWDSMLTLEEDALKSDVCSWTGVVDCFQNEFGELVVQAINIKNAGLAGNLPDDICLLSHLERLELSSNELSGSIPSCLVNSLALRELLLSDNAFTSGLPLGILLVPTLEELQVADNRLVGDLDSLIEGTFVKNVYRYGETWRLRQLNLHNNFFSGSVPAFFGALGSLKSLTLHGNDLAGEADDLLCDRTRELLAVLTADCSEVACSCCTACY
jgi:hypothetical protein